MTTNEGEYIHSQAVREDGALVEARIDAVGDSGVLGT
jgi:hypothetical protein